jgi:hypothetical protein
MLGPAELKLIRADAGISVASSTVIEPDPVNLGGPMFMMCYEECGGGGGGWTPPPNPDLRIVTIATSGIVDNNNPFESNEFEFRATASNGATQSPVVRCTGIPSTGFSYAAAYCASTLVHSLAPTEVGYVDVDVVETDGWPNPDDQFVDWFHARPDAVAHPPRVMDQAGFTLYKFPNPPSVGAPYVQVQFSW